MSEPLYKVIASAIQARQNCAKSPVNEFGLRLHTETLDQCDNLLPSGSGIDCGTKIDREQSKADRLVFNFSFHHMDEMGGYDGWTEHTLIVTPSLQFDFELRITGKDRNQIKEYLYDVFRHALNDEVESEVIGEGVDREIRYFSVSMRDASGQIV